MDDKGREKRRGPRVAVQEEAPASLRVTVPISLVDLSVEGLQFELASSLRPGTVYDLRLHLGDLALKAHVKIVRCRAGRYVEDTQGRHYLLFRVGAVFTQISDEMKEKLGAWVKDRSVGPSTRGELHATD